MTAMVWVNPKAILITFTLTMVGVVSGCAGDNTPTTVAAPVVLITSPANNATGVLLSKPIAVAFSKAMKADTFTATNFTATSSSGSVISGAITYANGYATLTPSPSALLAPSTLYTVTVSGVQASDEGVLAAPYSWNFTTGPLDPDFGNGGVVVTPVSMTLGGGARAVAVQTDGKVVAVGYVHSGGGNYDFAVVRYNVDGSRDPTFGAGGIVITNVSTGPAEARAVAIQADGDIVVAGVTDNGTDRNFVVMRYKAANGLLDPAFGAGSGSVAINFGGVDEAYAVAIDGSDGIVVVGKTGATLAPADFALVRLLPTGFPDTAFGASGIVITPIGADEDAAHSVVIQADGKIVAAGIADSMSGSGISNDFALARYNANGSLDFTFGGDGKVTTAVGSADEGAFAVGIQSSGKVVAAGVVFNGANSDFGLARYNTDGSLDSTFGVGGVVVTDMAGGNDAALALIVQPGDKIVVAGAAFVTGQGNDLALARYNSDGSLDHTFDADGKVVTNVSAAQDTAFGLALRPSGKVVLAGSTGAGAGANFLLVGFVAP